MEGRYKTEMEEHKQKLDKEYENLRQSWHMELDRLKKKNLQELEKKVIYDRLLQYY